MKSPPFIAVDCGASRVACARVATERSGGVVVRNATSEALDDGWVTETEWLEQAVEALRRVVARAGFRGTAQLSLPGHVTLAKHVTTPAIAAANRERILRFEAAQNIPHPLEDVVWDSIVTAEEERELSVLLIAAKRRVAMELCAVAEEVGLQVTQVWPSWLALARAQQLNDSAQGGSVLLADVGARSTQLIWCDGCRVGVRILAFGGRSVTLAIARELQIPTHAAEELKRAINSGQSNLPAGSPQRVTVRRAGELFGDRLQREIVRSVLSLPCRAAFAPPGMVRLCGGGARVETLVTQLTERLRLPVQWVTARDTDSEADSPIASTCQVGLPTAGGTPDVNLLPESIRAGRILRVRERGWLAAAALLVLALLPGIGVAEHRATANAARALEIEQRLRPRRELARRNAEALAELADLERREGERRAELAGRAQWLRFLADLQGRLAIAGDVWLETLTVVRASERDAGPGGEHKETAALRFRISGKLLDLRGAPAADEADAPQRLRGLLASIERSPFVAAIEAGRFENSEPGLLRFEASLVAAAGQPW